MSQRARQAGATAAGGGVRKLTIKPLRAPSLPADFELVTWQKLQCAVRAVHEKQPVQSSLEELYRAVEDLCTHKMAAATYARLQEECERQTERSLRALVSGVSDPSAFLFAIHGVWNEHCQQSLMIRSIFLFLDRTYPLQTPGVRSLWDMGLQHFRQHLLALPEVLNKTVSGLLLHVQRERLGEQVERSLLHNLVRMFCALQIYADRFEGPLLERTAAFYAAEATRLLPTSTVGEYLRHVEGRLAEEGSRVQSYLHASTRKPLLSAVHAALLSPHTEALLEKGFDKLVEEARTDDLRRMYTLYSHVGALRLVRDAWAAHIKVSERGGARTRGDQRARGGWGGWVERAALRASACPRADACRRRCRARARPPRARALAPPTRLAQRVGTELVLDVEKESGLVDQLLQLKAQCDELHALAFERADAFGYALREAFEALINAKPNRPAELLAKYLDTQLRAGAKGGGGGGEDELERCLDRAMALFRFLNGKDMFEAFYKKDLAKRLLVGRSASLDAEKLLISKLKAECGAGFTNKLEGMFRDMELSADLNAAFGKAPAHAAGSSASGEVELSVHVLTTGFWPHYPPVELKLPPLFGGLQEQFSAFYLAKHSGRRLSWVPSLGHCLVRANFAAKAHELQLSLLQTVVCLLFNSADTLSLDDIATGSGIGAPPWAGRAAAAGRGPRARRAPGLPPRSRLTPPPRRRARAAASRRAVLLRRGQGAAADAAVARVRQGARAEQGAEGP